jgi:single-strand DNA-binding protein
MNKVCLIGRLTTKPELRYTTTNIATTRFSVAINRQFKDTDGERKADFIPVQCWRKQAENVCNYLNKGSLVSIEGRIQTEKYMDKDGNNHYAWVVVADNVTFLESKNAQKNENAVQNSESVQPSEDPFAEF